MEVVVSVEHITSTTISSYKEKLLPPNPTDVTKIISIILEQMRCYLEENNIALHEELFPPLDLSCKHRLYKPWEKSIIIKVVGRKVRYSN